MVMTMDNSEDPSVDSLVYKYLMDKISQLKRCAKNFRKTMSETSRNIKPNFDLKYYINAGKHSTDTQTTAKKRKVKANDNKNMKLTHSTVKQMDNKNTDTLSSKGVDSKSKKQNVVQPHSIDNKPLNTRLSPISKTQTKSNTNTPIMKSQSKQQSTNVMTKQFINNDLDDSSEEEIPKSFSPVGDKNSTDEELPSISKLFSLKVVETENINQSLVETSKTPELKKKRKKTSDNHSDLKHKDLTKSKKKKRKLE